MLKIEVHSSEQICNEMTSSVIRFECKSLTELLLMLPLKINKKEDNGKVGCNDYIVWVNHHSDIPSVLDECLGELHYNRAKNEIVMIDVDNKINEENIMGKELDFNLVAKHLSVIQEVFDKVNEVVEEEKGASYADELENISLEVASALGRMRKVIQKNNGIN